MTSPRFAGPETRAPHSPFRSFVGVAFFIVASMNKIKDQNMNIIADLRDALLVAVDTIANRDQPHLRNPYRKAAADEVRRRRMRDRGAVFVLRGVSSLEDLGAAGAELIIALEAAGIGLELVSEEES